MMIQVSVNDVPALRVSCIIASTAPTTDLLAYCIISTQSVCQLADPLK